MDPAKVLVVDDERSILLLLKEALSQWGYQVTVASSAAEALGLLKSELFDALITDIRMPDMSGLELLREVKKQDESIEVVMMTGYPTIASAVQALKEGAYDYLSKPLILDELRPPPHPFRPDDDLRVGQVGDGIERAGPDGEDAGDAEDQREREHQPATTRAPLDEALEHQCPPWAGSPPVVPRKRLSLSRRN